MGLSYSEAIRLIEAEARRHRHDVESRIEKVPLHQAVNRVSGCALHAPQSTPRCDTSAMDGYAVNSQATQTASPERPVSFRVKGLMAAGKESLPDVGFKCTKCECECQTLSCLEIMTGGRFPSPAECGIPGLDCCVKVEDVTRVEDPATGGECILVSKPARYRQHRRLAGEDFQRDSLIVSSAMTIRPRHVMALASVGFTEIPVLPKLRVGLYSTGSELRSQSQSQSQDQPVSHLAGDANAPFIAAALADMGIDVQFLGVLDDDVQAITQKMKSDLVERDGQRYDVIISTGAVSTGRFDLIPHSLQQLGARTIFHKTAIRPGHPALFASIPRRSAGDSGDIPFFGLPGNPVASAACLRFLVVPYLNCLQSRLPESPIRARLKCPDGWEKSGSARLVARFPGDKDTFRPGIYCYTADSKVEVVLIEEHSPGKVRPFLGANCWIHIYRDVTGLWEGDYVDIYPDV